MQIKKVSPLKSFAQRKQVNKADPVYPNSQSPKGKIIKQKLSDNEREITSLNLLNDKNQQQLTRFGPYSKFQRLAKQKIEKPQQSLSLYHQNFTGPKITRDVSQESQKRNPSICDNLPVYFPKVIKTRDSQNENLSQEPSCVFYNLRAMECNQKSVVNPQSYYSPKNDFYLGSLKPVRINQNFQRNESSKSDAQLSPPTSIRADMKNYFQQLNMKTNQDNENNFTVRLRKSLTSLQQNKEQIINLNQLQNKMSRGNSQNNSRANLIQNRQESRSQEDVNHQIDNKIKFVRGLFYGEDDIKTIVKGKYQPTMVERNLTKKLMLNRQANNENQSSQDKQSVRDSQELLIDSKRSNLSKTPYSAVKQLYKEFDPSLEFSETPNLLFKLQKSQNQLGQPSIQNKTSLNDLKDKPSLIKLKLISNPQNQPIQLSQFNSFKLLTDPQQDDPTSNYYNNSPLMRKKQIDLINIKTEQQKLDEYQIQKPCRTEHTYNYSSHEKLEQKRQISRNNVETVKTERILDLLLLSTCELKNYFNNDTQKRPKVLQGKKVKIFHSKQLFPGDFFSVPQK